MTDAQPPGGEHDDPLLRAVHEHWAEIERLADRDQLDRLTGLLAGTAEPDPDEARAALADELLDLLPPGHPIVRLLRSSPLFSNGAQTGVAASRLGGRIESIVLATTDAGVVPVTIYLADEPVHAAVEAAVAALLASAGLRIEDRDDPVIGSWFRRMTARATDGVRSPAGQDAVLTAVHAIDSRVVLGQDPEVTAKLLQNVAPVVGALQPTRDAVVRAGALLIVKRNGVVSVLQLTAAQQARLDHRPQLASSPPEIVAALGLDPGASSAAELGDVAIDLCVEEPVLGRPGRFLRETGVSFGRLRVAPVPVDELPPREQRRLGLDRIRLTAVVLPFDLDEPPDACRYLQVTVRMTFDDPSFGSRHPSSLGLAEASADVAAEGLLDMRGVGRQELAWTLTAHSELIGLRPRSREVLAVLESPWAAERLTGTLDARVRFTTRMLGIERTSVAERRSPVRFTLNVADGTFETLPDQGLAAPQ